MNPCGQCQYGNTTEAVFCVICGALLPVFKDPRISDEERRDRDLQRSAGPDGVCCDDFHALLQAREGHCDICKTWCKKDEHVPFQKNAFNYCPACGVKFQPSA